MTEAQIRAAHPDWTDEQVQAELDSQPAQPPADPPARPDSDRDEAFARERRARTKAEQELADERKAREDRERKEAEERGEHQRIAEQERERANRLEAEKAQETSRRNAERLAGEKKFKDAGYALYLLAEDQVDLSDGAAVGAALDRIAANKPDLIAGSGPPPPSGGPAGGSKGDGPKLNREQIAAMSPKAIAKLSDDDLAAALSSGS